MGGSPRASALCYESRPLRGEDIFLFAPEGPSLVAQGGSPRDRAFLLDRTANGTHELRDLDAQRYVLEGLWLQRAVKPTAATVRPPWNGRWRSPPAATRCRRSGSSRTSGTSPSAPTPNTAHEGARCRSPAGRPTLGRTLRGPRPRQALRRLDVRAGRRRPAASTRARTGPRARLRRQPDPRAGRHRRRDAPPGGHPRAAQHQPGRGARRRVGRADARRPVAAARCRLYEALVAAGRRMAEVLAKEDIVALEQRHRARPTWGSTSRHRQILPDHRAARDRAPGAPGQAARRPQGGADPRPRRGPVPGRRLHLDLHRGSIESLLHSQLAYMERRTTARTCST